MTAFLGRTVFLVIKAELIAAVAVAFALCVEYFIPETI